MMDGERSTEELFQRFVAERVRVDSTADERPMIPAMPHADPTPVVLPYGKAFQALVNYWEIKPTLYEQRLTELALQDVSAVAAFVPWAHVETDIYHSLKKFLRAAKQARLKVKLYVMPELGMNYPNAGIPKEILAAHANLATDRRGQVIHSLGAPNIFPLPSFYAPEVIKRFGNFIIKVGSVLGELASELQASEFCEVMVSNSFFNYYRSYGLRAADHGDYSAAHVMAFREFLDREYPGADGEPFKRQVYEPHNRHRFTTHVEKSLREKTEMVFSRKNGRFPIHHVDMLNPECAPDAAQHALLCEVFDFKPSTALLYQQICEGAARGETIFLNGAGAFRRLSDQEKSFLALASLIHTGDVIMGADELARLPEGFRRKVGLLLNTIRDREYMVCRRMRYTAASKFAGHPRATTWLSKVMTGALSYASSIAPSGDVSASFHERLLFVDPHYVMRQADLLQALTTAQGGKVVVLPAPGIKVPNYMPEAAAQFERFRKGRQCLKINLGLAYEVYDYNLGKVVFYDPDVFWSEQAVRDARLDLFFKAMLGLADVQPVCTVSDARIQVVSHVSKNDPGDKLLFLVNPTSEAVLVKIIFEKAVSLVGVPEPASGGETLTGTSFELEVPSLGVLSLRMSESAGAPVWN